MIDSDPFSLMLQCNGAQLDTVTTKLKLNSAYLPGQAEAIATRASAILKLAEQLKLLPKLTAILSEFFPPDPNDGAVQERRILFLAANPIATQKLSIDAEIRLIEDRLQESALGGVFRLQPRSAVRITELSRFLLEHRPEIVHFSGHGSPTGEIILEDETGRAAPLPPSVLANLFSILQLSTECIVLNACYTSELAKALADYAGCVIGMSKAIGDASALRFSAGFYRGLAFGRDYQTAFRLGCNEIDLLTLPDAAVPHFMTRQQDQVAAAEVVSQTERQVLLRSPVRTWLGSDRGLLLSDGPDTPRLYPVWFGTNRQRSFKRFLATS